MPQTAAVSKPSNNRRALKVALLIADESAVRTREYAHRALGDRRAGCVSVEAGIPARGGGVYRWVRRWSMRRTMTAMASIVAGLRGGMAAHVSSQNAIVSSSTPAGPPSVS